MLSMNQLSVLAQDFEESKGFNNFQNNNSFKKGNNSINTSLFDNQSNSRQLFRKCKQIIQQQMIQINNLSQENQRLVNEISQWQQICKDKENHIQQLMRDKNEAIQKNDILHKQMSKLKKILQEKNKQLLAKQNMIKLKQNKTELIQDSLKQTMIQKNTLQEKCIILEQTVQLLKKELDKAEDIIGQKDSQMKYEIQQLKRVKSILERNSKLQRLDEFIVFNNSSNSKENRVRLSEGRNDKIICRPYFTVQQESPFNKIDLKQQINTYQKTYYQLPQRSQFYSAQLTRDYSNKMHSINPFSIVDQRDQRHNISPVSRIRKNLSKPKSSHDVDLHNTSKRSISKSKLRENLTRKLSNKNDTSFLMGMTSQLTNPEMSQQLSNIKKEILQQYSKMEIKKGLVSHDRINQTLQEIENKLEKMAKISAIDQSQSQFQ